MAIPFYEPHGEETLQQQHNQSAQQQQLHDEVDQVDGHVMSSPPNVASTDMPPPNSPPPMTEGDVTAWKLLALAMCKALKDHYQQNLATSSSNSSTAVIQILPNGQVKPSWN